MFQNPVISHIVSTVPLRPDSHKLFRTLWTRPSTIFSNLAELILTSDHYAQTMFGLSLDENIPQSPAPTTHQTANYYKLQGKKFNENHQRILTSPFKGITTCIYLITFNLTFSPQFTSTNWFEQLQHNWSHSSQIWQVSGFFSENITLFSIQQFNASAHCPCAHSHNPCNF